MKAGRPRLLTVLLLVLGCSASLFGQPAASQDSVFRLLEAERAEQYEQYGIQYRLVKGHARFLHNDTYLLCDSASWNVNTRFIEAFGNVRLIQDKTMLKSEEMLYWIDENRALFRGTLVELIDKDGNTLRTERLTYNTKDSVAVFEYGGSMKDKDGNVIESRTGTYDAKEGLFTFDDNVELYMDSIEIKTHQLRYFNDSERAHFGRNTFVWRDQGFLRADAGWYDRPTQVIHFADHVFMFDPSYDAWADEVYYHQQDGAVDLLRNAQVLDSTNKSVYLGDRMQYLPATDSLSQRGVLTGDPAIIYYGENENHVVDTLYARADTFYVYSVPRNEIPEAEVKEAEKRLDDMLFDALTKKRIEEGEAREKERIQKMRDAGKLPPEWVEKQQQATADSLAKLAAADSLAALMPQDSLAALDSLSMLEIPGQAGNDVDTLSVIPDSLAVAARDTIVAPPDTTPIRYVHGWSNVKMYRSDLQGVCDSVVFCELDSIARLYGRPVLWNEVRNQLSADEMQLLMKGGTFERGSMVTNAWIISQQDSIHFNQIRSTEMQGWFRDNKLYRFDALGGVAAIFYLVEEEVVTTINVKEAKSLTAALKDGTAQRLLYMEAIKSDAYPVGELELSKQRLKGFEWRGEERPVSREDITQRQVRETERKKYENLSKPLYRETNKFFDGYMYDLFEQINARKRAELERRERERDSIARVQDSIQRALMEAFNDEIPGQAGNDVAVGALPQTPQDTLSVISVDSTSVTPDSSTVIPGLTGNLDSTVVETPKPVVQEQEPVIQREAPVRVTEEVTAVASPETVVRTEELTRAEKRALRKAERQARKEARRAARAARRAERAAAREAARAARRARK